MKGRQTGVKEENEKISVRIIPLEDLWSVSPDSKVLCALTLYSQLKKKGLIE